MQPTAKRVESIVPAKMLRRALAAAVDLSIVTAVFYWAALQWGERLPTGNLGFRGWAAPISFALVYAYWVLQEWAIGATLGKILFGLRVVSEDGRECSLTQALKRNLLRLIDIIFFYAVGLVVALLNRKRQRLGDLWAGTLVVTAATFRELRTSKPSEMSS